MLVVGFFSVTEGVTFGVGQVCTRETGKIATLKGRTVRYLEGKVLFVDYMANVGKENVCLKE